jgi:hypothetical protein
LASEREVERQLESLIGSERYEALREHLIELRRAFVDAGVD